MLVSFKMDGDVAVLTMDDGKRNAINHQMVDALNAGLDEAERKAKCVVIKGREGAFSAGFDLKFFAVCSLEERAGLLKAGSMLVARLLRFPMPVIAACTGHGIAMGGFLLLACDFRYGIKGDFKVGAPESQIGMQMPVFAIELAKERIPVLKRSQLFCEGIMTSPEEVVEGGFLDAAVDANLFDETVMAHAEALAKLDPKIFAFNRTALRKSAIDVIEASHDGKIMPVID